MQKVQVYNILNKQSLFEKLNPPSDLDLECRNPFFHCTLTHDIVELQMSEQFRRHHPDHTHTHNQKKKKKNLGHMDRLNPVTSLLGTEGKWGIIKILINTNLCMKKQKP